jgi:hypothetical protein
MLVERSSSTFRKLRRITSLLRTNLNRTAFATALQDVPKQSRAGVRNKAFNGLLAFFGLFPRY